MRLSSLEKTEGGVEGFLKQWRAGYQEDKIGRRRVR